LFLIASIFLILLGVVVSAIRNASNDVLPYVETQCQNTNQSIITNTVDQCTVYGYLYFVRYENPVAVGYDSSVIGSILPISFSGNISCWFNVENRFDVQTYSKTTVETIAAFSLLSGLPFMIGFTLWFPLYLAWAEYKKHEREVGLKEKLQKNRNNCLILILAILLAAGFITGTVFSAIFGDTLPYQMSDCVVNDKYFEVKAIVSGRECLPDYYFKWNVTILANQKLGEVINGPYRFLEELTALYNLKEVGQTSTCYYEGDTVVWSRELLWPWIVLSILSGIFFLLTIGWAISEFLRKRKSAKVVSTSLGPSDNDL